MSYGDTLRAMDPISLPELEMAGALLTRKDRKYLVPRSELAGLIETLQGDVRVLEINQERSFRYESVYYDTPEFTFYLGAARTRRHRFKVRTRTYLDSGYAMLEVKTRNGRDLNEKHRRPHPVGATLTPEGLAFISQFDGVAAVGARLQPVLTTRFRRSTLFDESTLSRMTIDTALSWQASGYGSYRMDGYAVVETKSAGGPSPADRVLWAAHHRPAKVSKYCTGLAALNPQLPANRWARTLRTYFAGSPRMMPMARGDDMAPVARGVGACASGNRVAAAVRSF